MKTLVIGEAEAMGGLKEPELRNVIGRYGDRSLNPSRRGNELTDSLAWKLYSAIEPIAPTSAEGTVRALWFNVSRGAVDDWMTQEEFSEYIEEEYWGENEVPPRGDEARKAEWLEWFPEEEYWHDLAVYKETIRGEDWLRVFIDNRCICDVMPAENIYERDRPQARYSAPDLDHVLSQLADVACKVVEGISDGSYASLLKSKLPYSFRYGLIKRRDFWSATHGEGRMGCIEIPVQEKEVLLDLLRRQPSRTELPAMPSMTTGEYFRALRDGYIKCGYDLDDSSAGLYKFEKDDPRRWYARFGDARDRSLLEVDPDSPQAFREWYLANKNVLDHNFEIFMGRGCSRVHMNPELRDDGSWSISLWGSITWHAADIARMWKHMNEAGLPVYLHDADAVADALEGSDYVLVVPRHDPIDYVRGEHFGKRISTAVHIWEEYYEAIVMRTNWQPLPVPSIV
ncbi:hypothetical protein [uncultured Adlercreutzia sp.]|uniref:hypothetical protein n=1 Tax=uncultured Adlercreutzia sp. TaxID=875803 RepID=UPI0026F3C260|nr:hypothetical protein [uncultured Adlercreutzia sp.]